MERKGEVEWMVREQRRREELKLQTVERREERKRGGAFELKLPGIVYGHGNNALDWNNIKRQSQIRILIQIVLCSK